MSAAAKVIGAGSLISKPMELTVVKVTDPVTTVAQGVFAYKDLLEKLSKNVRANLTFVAKFLSDPKAISKLEQLLKDVQSSIEKLQKLIFDLNAIDFEDEMVSALIDPCVDTMRSALHHEKSLAEKGDAPYVIPLDRQQTQTIISKLEKLIDFPKPKSREPTWKELRLHEEQLLLKKCGAFSDLLKNLNQLVQESNQLRAHPIVFISYAWPSLDRPYERWVQPFLEVLYEHLREAGVLPLLDRKDSRYGFNTFAHMEKLKTAHHVLLVGTDSLLDKHLSSKSRAVHTELNLIRDRQEDKGFVCPVLLSGKLETAFPPDFRRYGAIEAFIDPDAEDQVSYLICLQKLLEQFFQVPIAGNGRKCWDELWSQLHQQHPELFQGVTADYVSNVLSARKLIELEEQKNQTLQLDILCKTVISLPKDQ